MNDNNDATETDDSNNVRPEHTPLLEEDPAVPILTPSTPQHTLSAGKGWLTEFTDYASDIRSVSGILSKSLFLSPIVAGMLLSFGPPWPSAAGASVLTSLAEVLVAMYVFRWGAGSTKVILDRWLSITIVSSILGLVLYLFLFSFFVRDMPDAKHRDVKGIHYTSTAAQVISPQYSEDAALKGAGYDPTMIWEPWSVFVIRVTIVLAWLIFFCSFSSYMAIFVVRGRLGD